MMPRHPRTAGFTLIELLVAVVIIGILAATSAPKFSATIGKANNSALRTDLRNLAVAEESYFYENSQYSSDLATLRFQTTRNVAVTVVTATAGGWAATATHVAANPVTCGIFLGDAAPPLGATSVPGRIDCE